MPRRRSRPDEHTFLGIRVERHDVRVSASLNYNARGGRPIVARDDDLLYDCSTSVTLYGVATYPPERSADTYEVQLHGDPSSRLKATLKDVQARNEYGAGEYKSYRGEQYPVYAPPPGLATLERRRSDRTWSAWIRVAPSVVSDALALLMQSRPLYVSLHERKVERHRWIVSVTLQSTDPAEE